MASIQGIYIALFGRPADPIGLNYFNSITNNGQNLASIGNLAGQPEYLNRFEGMNNAQIVTSIYQELFGRNPDLAGLQFFTQQLNSGAQTINTIAINILDGAQGEDRALVNAKIAAADLFTAAVAADPDALAAYQGEAGIQFGQSFLAQIDESSDTLTAAQVQAQVAAFGDGETSIPGVPGTPGEIFTLTPAAGASTGIDNIQGTANNDTIRAIDAGSLSTSDVINGGAGFDTLNISDDAIGGTAAPVITNVERINNSDAGATLNLSSVSGVEQIWSNSPAAGPQAFTYTNASVGTVFGASGAAATTAVPPVAGTQTINIDYVNAQLAGRTTAQLATSNTGGQIANFDFGADATSIEAVSINAVSGNGQVGIDADVTTLDTITVTGAGRVQVNSLETTITTFDASANTGGVSFQSGVLAQAATVTGGSGNDVINLSSAGNFVMTVNAGAGNDQVTGGTGNDVINLGAGNDIVFGSTGADTVTLGTGNDVVAYSAADQSTFVAGGTNNTMDTITDFNSAGDDVFQVSAAVGTSFNTQANNIAIQTAVSNLAADATLAQALAEVTDDRAAIGAVSYFQFQGDTYVVSAGATTGYDAGDLVVKLTGLVDLTASDFQFV